jgi:hypothetical protein
MPVTNRVLLVALVCVCPGALGAQATHPDLVGTWILDASKSTVDGPIPAPTAATYVVGQHGDTITLSAKQTDANGEVALDRIVATDGYRWNNTMVYQGTRMALSSEAKWNGAVLSIQTTSDFNGTPVQQSETWTLSADGKTLTTATTTNINGTYYASTSLVFMKK